MEEVEQCRVGELFYSVVTLANARVVGQIEIRHQARGALNV